MNTNTFSFIVDTCGFTLFFGIVLVDEILFAVADADRRNKPIDMCLRGRSKSKTKEKTVENNVFYRCETVNIFAVRVMR